MPLTQEGPSSNANIGSYFDVAGNQINNYHNPGTVQYHGSFLALTNHGYQSFRPISSHGLTLCSMLLMTAVLEQIQDALKEPVSR